MIRERINWILLGAAILIVALSPYAGYVVFLPVLPVVAVWWVAKKTLSKERQIFLLVCAVQLGHALGFFVFNVFARLLSPGDIIGVVVYIGTAAWLLWKPSSLSATAVGLVQSLAVGFDVLLLIGDPISPLGHKTIVAAVG